MSKKNLLALAVAILALLGGPAFAEICDPDPVPAATLLLPYFEVALSDPNGPTTLFSINNASAAAALAHVTLWTDESCPSLDFDVYLTGYDVQTINIRDIFNGNLPRTADLARDPTDSSDPNDGISNRGIWPAGVANPPQDVTFPGCGSSLPYTNPALSPTLITHLRELHTGGLSPIYGRCCGLDYGDNVARGYITVDSVNQCNLEFPSAPGYFIAGGQGLANNRNVLWGDYFYVNPAAAFAQGETLVHVEACDVPSVGQGADDCPFIAGDYTFYGRYVAASAADGREPLSTMFATRYLNSATPFPGGTSLVVWRDAKVVADTGHSCSTQAAWFPLNQADVVAFDEMENCTDLCFRGDNVSPPTGGADTCFPAETQKVSLLASAVPGGASPTPPYPFGWMYLNLNTSVSGGVYNPNAQAFVTTVMEASGQFSVGFEAIRLDSACDTTAGGVVLIP